MMENEPLDTDHAERPDRSGRVAALMARAATVVQWSAHAAPELQIGSVHGTSAVDVAKLIEDLRTYQVELEVQNEELRSAQQALEFAHSRYQTLFGQMPLPAMVLDRNGMVEQSNDAANTLLGYRKAGQTLDNRFFRRLARADAARLHVATSALVHGDPQVVPRVALHAQGQPPLTFDLHLIKLPQTYHLDHRVMALMVDCTAEVAREQDQHFYSMLLNSSEDLVYATDLQGCMLIANHALLQLVGHTHSEVIGHPPEDFFSLRDAVLHRKTDQQVLQNNEPVSLDERIHRYGANEPLELLTRKFPLHDLQGRVFGVGAISTDVTDIRAQQRQAQLSESVFLSATEAILITDADTCIVRVNPAFTTLTGFSEGSVVGYPASVLRADGHETWFHTAIWKALETDGHWAGELTDRASDGRKITVWNTINSIRDERGKVAFYVVVQTDLTQLRAAESEVRLLASHDSLTGLPNRSLFNDRLTQLLAYAERNRREFSLLFIDLDHFKDVNDTLGHQVGDILLQTIGQRLKAAVRAEDTVARMGGDEFVVLLNSAARASAVVTAEKLLVLLNAPVVLDGITPYQPMASVGLVVYPQDGSTAEALLAHADTAMYEAKTAGRNRVASHTQAMSDASARNFSIQTELSNAIDRHELRLYFQPKVHLQTGELAGVEALVRWERPEHGLVAPGHFIAAAERSGLIVKLDQWVLREAIAQIAKWRQAGFWQPNMRMAVNLCARDLRRPELPGELHELLTKFGVSPSCIELEITEGSLLDRSVEIIERLQALRQMGVTLAMDDFGTGFSSLSYLRNFPISVIKIDQSFIRDMMQDNEDRILVETIVAMAQSLKRELVAEGIETDAQRLHLLSIGCEVGQGYWFGHPVPPLAFETQHFISNAKH